MKSQQLYTIQFKEHVLTIFALIQRLHPFILFKVYILSSHIFPRNKMAKPFQVLLSQQTHAGLFHTETISFNKIHRKLLIMYVCSFFLLGVMSYRKSKSLLTTIELQCNIVQCFLCWKHPVVLILVWLIINILSKMFHWLVTHFSFTVKTLTDLKCNTIWQGNKTFESSNNCS